MKFNIDGNADAACAKLKEVLDARDTAFDAQLGAMFKPAAPQEKPAAPVARTVAPAAPQRKPAAPVARTTPAAAPVKGPHDSSGWSLSTGRKDSGGGFSRLRG